MKDIEKVKEQIQKLFALMEDNSGASQGEVESALKAARKLMAKYKLSEKDVIEKKSNVIKETIKEIDFTTIVNPWVMTLGQVIADNYCCRHYISKYSGRRTMNIGFVGFEDDFEMASKIFRYAYDCIISEHSRNMRGKKYTHKELTSILNAFGNGYVRGIKEVFAEQNKTEECFAVVLQTPQEVNDRMNGKEFNFDSINTSNATNRARNYDSYAVRGYQRGKEFKIGERLAG